MTLPGSLISDPSELVIRWIQLFNGQELRLLQGLYTNNALFMPSLSSDFLEHPENREIYFYNLFTQNARARLKNSEVKHVNDDLTLVTGLNNFHIRQPDGRDLIVPEHFSLVLVKSETGYQIQHHHSSITKTTCGVVPNIMLDNAKICMTRIIGKKNLFCGLYQTVSGAVRFTALIDEAGRTQWSHSSLSPQIQLPSRKPRSHFCPK